MFRQKELQVLVNETTKPTFYVYAVGEERIIYKRSAVLPVVIRPPKRESVSAQHVLKRYTIPKEHRQVNWSEKSKRRRTTGTGRMRYLRHLPRRFKNGFREGVKASSNRPAPATSGM